MSADNLFLKSISKMFNNAIEILDIDKGLANQIKSWGTEPPIPVNVDIYNMSYGRGYAGEAEKYTFADYLEASLEDALIYGVENLRGGKGAIYVQSAGNGFNDYPAENSGVNCGTKLTCTSIAIDDNQSVPHII